MWGCENMGRRITIILAMMVGGLVMVTGCQSSPEPVTEGDLAPDFKLQDLDGETVSLSGLRGRPVLLNFWATWCYWCFVEMPYLEEVYEEWTSNELAVLTIAKGERLSTVKNYMQRYGLSLPVLLDTREIVTNKYGVRGIPVTFFIDKDGIIQGKRIGAFQSKEAIDVYLEEIIP